VIRNYQHLNETLMNQAQQIHDLKKELRKQNKKVKVLTLKLESIDQILDMLDDGARQFAISEMGG